jgi:HEAT repeat protein
MRRVIIGGTAPLVAGLLFAPVILAQDQDTTMPRVENARVETRALAGPLAEEIQKWVASAAQPRWLGYSVPAVARDRNVCCGNYGDSGLGCRTCRLEGDDRSVNRNSANAVVKLEGSRDLVVLLRSEGKRVAKIRVASEECSLDAGGLPFVWLTGVKPAQGVDLLAKYVFDASFDDRDGRSVGNGALTAIALHADEAADRAMQSFVQPEQRESLRKQAAFWLGEARGKAGLRILEEMAKSDPSSDVRSHVAFALSVSHEPGALDAMIKMAKDDENSHVRGQALFWLAQKAGQKAMGAITGAIDNDPDTEVKMKAVFALCQLPKDEGVPKLIEVAQNNHNPAVRKQAMFWLGQSNDPRALAFFEKILSQ